MQTPPQKCSKREKFFFSKDSWGCESKKMKLFLISATCSMAGTDPGQHPESRLFAPGFAFFACGSLLVLITGQSWFQFLLAPPWSHTRRMGNPESPACPVHATESQGLQPPDSTFLPLPPTCHCSWAQRHLLLGRLLVLCPGLPSTYPNILTLLPAFSGCF